MERKTETVLVSFMLCNMRLIELYFTMSQQSNQTCSAQQNKLHFLCLGRKVGVKLKK